MKNLVIRLKRVGLKKKPFYTIVVTEKKLHVTTGKVFERLGYYTPLYPIIKNVRVDNDYEVSSNSLKKLFFLNFKRAAYYLNKNAELSYKVANICSSLYKKNILLNSSCNNVKLLFELYSNINFYWNYIYKQFNISNVASAERPKYLKFLLDVQYNFLVYRNDFFNMFKKKEKKYVYQNVKNLNIVNNLYLEVLEKVLFNKWYSKNYFDIYIKEKYYSKFSSFLLSTTQFYKVLGKPAYLPYLFFNKTKLGKNRYNKVYNNLFLRKINIFSVINEKNRLLRKEIKKLKVKMKKLIRFKRKIKFNLIKLFIFAYRRFIRSIYWPTYYFFVKNKILLNNFKKSYFSHFNSYTSLNLSFNKKKNVDYFCYSKYYNKEFVKFRFFKNSIHEKFIIINKIRKLFFFLKKITDYINSCYKRISLKVQNYSVNSFKKFLLKFRLTLIRLPRFLLHLKKFVKLNKLFKKFKVLNVIFNKFFFRLDIKRIKNKFYKKNYSDYKKKKFRWKENKFNSNNYSNNTYSNYKNKKFRWKENKFNNNYSKNNYSNYKNKKFRWKKKNRNYKDKYLNYMHIFNFFRSQKLFNINNFSFQDAIPNFVHLYDINLNDKNNKLLSRNQMKRFFKKFNRLFTKTTQSKSNLINSMFLYKFYIKYAFLRLKIFKFFFFFWKKI